MKSIGVVLALCLAVGVTAAEESPAERFEGRYQWNQGGDDRLSAEFTPVGDGAWRVSFRFEFNGKDYSWKGAAEGSLDEGGALTGTVESDGGRRTWIFEAAIEDGVMKGRHSETTSGNAYATGTFVLKR